MEDKKTPLITQQEQMRDKPELPHLSTEGTMLDGFRYLLGNGSLSDEIGKDETIKPTEQLPNLDMFTRLEQIEQSLTDALSTIRELKNTNAPSAPESISSLPPQEPEPKQLETIEAPTQTNTVDASPLPITPVEEAPPILIVPDLQQSPIGQVETIITPQPQSPFVEIVQPIQPPIEIPQQLQQPVEQVQQVELPRNPQNRAGAGLWSSLGGFFRGKK